MIATKKLTCKVYTSFHELYDIQEEWDKFLLDMNGDIYLSFDWCRVWWKCYGKGRELKIFLYYNDDTLVGIIPVFIEKLKLIPSWLRIAKIVGSDFTIVMVSPPVQMNYAEEIFQQLINHLLYRYRCDAIWLGPVSENSDTLSFLRSASAGFSKSEIVMHEKIHSPYTVFNLSNSFESYLVSLKKRQRGNYKRDNNLLKKSFKIRMDVLEDTEEFEDFVKLHESQWQADGKMGHFKDWPLGYEFNKALASVQSQKGRFRLIRLKADDRAVSYQLCFVFGKTLYWRLPARTSGPEWNRFGLGRLGLIKMIKWAILKGYKTIEAGAGHYDYKIKSGGVEHNLTTVLIMQNKWIVRQRVRIFSFMSDILNLFYYKKWFLRIAPKLPFKRVPLWKLWIRTHL